MNGEIAQASSIVISVRKALFDNQKIDFVLDKYVAGIRFLLRPKLWFFEPVQANSVQEWFHLSLKKGLKDVKFVIPSNKENKHLLGFVNTSQCAIICYWQNGTVSAFYPSWGFDRVRNVWYVTYTEQPMKKNKNVMQLSFSYQREEFKKALLDISKFAEDIEFPAFAKDFYNAYEVLCGSAEVVDTHIPKQLPEEFKAIYYATDKADRFGAMGSWNDSPPWYAREKGLEKEYNELSDELLVQLRYHLMYVANECWRKD